MLRLFSAFDLLFVHGGRNAGGTRAAACGGRVNERMRIAGLRRGEAAARAVLRTAIFTRVSHPAAVFRLPFVRTKGNVIKKKCVTPPSL